MYRAGIFAFLFAAVVGAQQGQNAGHPSWPCVPGRAVDPSYLEVSEATGGQLFLFQKGEVEHAALVMSASHSHPATIVRAVGHLSGSREFEVPVDSQTSSILLLASLQCRNAIAVIRPNGAEMTATNSARNVDLQAGRIVQVDLPEPGKWRIRLSGRVEPVGIDDASLFLARFRNGALATFEATRYARGHKALYTFEINGENASIMWDLHDLHRLQYFDHRDEGRVRGWRSLHITDRDHPYMDHWWVPGLQIGYEHTFIHQAADFLTAAAQNKSPSPTFRDGLLTDDVTDAVLASAANRSWTKVRARGAHQEAVL